MKEEFEHLVDYLLDNGFFLQQAVGLLEQTLIGKAMERSGGNRTAASKLLGIHRNTLQKKIEGYELEQRRFPSKRAVARKHVPVRTRRAG